ncbi:5,10-methylenetetrahydrofolate reductase [Nakamurella panacisegetis]|uniref:Methylenetetrahydrofolate reductase n=2 Tax=Nakamurella panacisegetis TaxID=1090615 RepID=A0A1H0K060_9ACTN|nr:5,10-methylenetetrahydrofolate reductase [Nakamurella panacisegetis]
MADGRGGFVLFALTPPREAASPQRVAEIAEATIKRLSSVELDGVILYDITDESDRNPDERPFPFLPTRDPATYLQEHFLTWPTPAIVYRAVGKYSEDQLRSWLSAQDTDRVLSVFVGASSRGRETAISLARAYSLRNEVRPDLVLGGVAIPERHMRRRDEHLRLIAKQEAGCSFFVTQVIFDANAAKNMISDYRHECRARGLPLVPIVFTFSVVGSLTTLEFLRWLGVEVPHWVERDLTDSATPLQISHDHALAVAADLVNYCRRMDVPFGINVESVSARRDEIEMSVKLAGQIAAVCGENVRPFDGA